MFSGHPWGHLICAHKAREANTLVGTSSHVGTAATYNLTMVR